MLSACSDLDRPCRDSHCGSSERRCTYRFRIPTTSCAAGSAHCLVIFVELWGRVFLAQPLADAYLIVD